MLEARANTCPTPQNVVMKIQKSEVRESENLFDKGKKLATGEPSVENTEIRKCQNISKIAGPPKKFVSVAEFVSANFKCVDFRTEVAETNFWERGKTLSQRSWQFVSASRSLSQRSVDHPVKEAQNKRKKINA